MLQLKNISKIYTAGKETKALDGINLNFGESGLVFITGKSGSGKSTLLNLIGGLDSPTDGEFIIDGKRAEHFTERDFDNYKKYLYRLRLSGIQSHIGFYRWEENVIFSFELQGEKQTREIVDGIFKKIRLTDGEGKSLYDRKINELSGGQKQRTALARALIKNPQIILADEPTGALDSETGENIFKILKEISSDKLVIAVTHDEEKAERYGDRIIKLCDGKTVSDTGETGETHNRKDCSFKDGKLPLKRIFTIATRWLKHKIARRVISVILSRNNASDMRSFRDGCVLRRD